MSGIYIPGMGIHKEMKLLPSTRMEQLIGTILDCDCV